MLREHIKARDFLLADKNWNNYMGRFNFLPWLSRRDPPPMPQRLMYKILPFFPTAWESPHPLGSQCSPPYLLLQPFYVTWANLSCSVKRGNRIPQEHRRPLPLGYAIPTPPPPHVPKHCEAGRREKVTRITWIKHCDRGPLGMGSHGGSQVSLFTAASPCGGMAL